MVDYGGRLRTIVDHNPRRRRKDFHDEQEIEEEYDDDEDDMDASTSTLPDNPSKPWL